MEEDIYLRITKGVAKPKKNKLGIFICGASGTGKTTMRDKFLRDLKIRTTFVYLNLDDIKEVGLEEARVLLAKLTARIINEGYSVLMDGTCRDKNYTTERIKLLKSKGYKVMVGIFYASLPTVLKRLEERRGQYVSEAVARDIYEHTKKNAETYMSMKDIDELYLYSNETKPYQLLSYNKTKKEITCIAGSEDEEFYFDISKYCN